MNLDLQHVNVKIPVAADSAVDLARLVEIFHGWISRQEMEEVLIDVADYRHVPGGPGVVLVGLEADYSLDGTGGSPGLRYNRKAAFPGADGDRFAQAFRSAARACRMLEMERWIGPPPRFDWRSFELFVNDRALAPNTPETRERERRALEVWLGRFFGSPPSRLDLEADPRKRFGARIELARPWDPGAIPGGSLQGERG